VTKKDRELPATPGPEVRTMRSDERIVRANGVNICVQTFGDAADSPRHTAGAGCGSLH
jgi:hypothetical protein